MEFAPIFITLGVLFLAGLAADTLGRRTRVPGVTLLLVIGVLIGSSGLALLPKAAIHWYEPLSIVALTMVAFLLGSSLRRDKVAAHGRAILAVSVAVVLATMPPLLAAMATAGRHGVLVKSAVVMEQLRTIEVVAFDKTGTLTEGTPQVERVDAFTGFSENDVLTLAAAAEMGSEHPIGTAIVDYSRSRGLQVPTATAFESTPGVGVRATVDGDVVTVSKPEAEPKALPSECLSRAECETSAERTAAERESGGMTAVIVRVGGEAIGVIALADTVRSNLAATIRELERVTGSSAVLLTGDNPRAAHAVAERVGIVDVRAGLLPEDKAEAVRELQGDDGRRVLLVGDGVNDAPALAASDIGVAMGRKGSDLALETADAVLIRDDLGTLASVIALSRRAHWIVVANLAIAASFIVVLVTWDLIGTLPLPIGVAGHESSTVIVALNGMRLLSSRAWNQRTRG